MAVPSRLAGLARCMRLLEAEPIWNRLRHPVAAVSRMRAESERRKMIDSVFDRAWYAIAYPEFKQSGLNALAHYHKIGIHQGYRPNGLFDEIWYRQIHPDVGSERHAVTHYLVNMKHRSPNYCFDMGWYIAHHNLAEQPDINPIAHYLAQSRRARVKASVFFDAEWYAALRPDAVTSGLDLLSHYLNFGAAEGCAPNALFDEHWYATQYGVGGGMPGVLRDYFSNGNDRCRDPHALFDTEWYLASYPDAAASTLNPLAHYLSVGAAKGYHPHLLFDPVFYRAQQHPHERTHDNPLIDYLSNEQNWGKSTHPLFSGAWYQRHNPDVVAHRVNPLRHFVQSGAREGRNPSPLFATRWYRETYPAVALSGRNALVDYLLHGAASQRNPNPLFDSAWYRHNNEDVVAAGLNPLVHYATAGWREHRNPGPDFDVDWYKAQYPETGHGTLDPLEHYLTIGQAAGYKTRPADRRTPDCDILDIPFEILRAPATLADRECCLFVTYAADGEVEDHVIAMLQALKQQGLVIVLVMVTEGLNQSLSPDLDFVDGILVRINHGWDFAAWATALAVFPDAWSSRLLVLANDSVYGPTDPKGIGRLLAVARASDKDIVSLTDSYQVQRHLMSYFTMITRSGLKNAGVRAFWTGVRSNRDKSTVIHEYELRSIERWNSRGTSFEVIFPATPGSGLPVNPTLAGWRDLVARGFPFVKVQLLRDFMDTFDATGWERLFAANRRLVPKIRKHLDSVQRRRPSPSRPVPAPKQRFVQSEDLTTYYGATTACRPADEVDLALEVPFRTVDASVLALPERVAVLAHVFYLDFCPDLLVSLDSMPVAADLFISTDTVFKQRAIQRVFATYANGDVRVEVFPNVGRDIAPMLVGFKDVFARYEIFVHVHSKKSLHDKALQEWRQFLSFNLLDGMSKVRSILHLLMAHHVGIVFSQHLPYLRRLLNYGGNFGAMKALLGRCGVELSKDLVLEFPSGSYIWGRCDALAPLLALNLGWDDFPAETGQLDGTLAHAIERSLLYIAEAAGYRWVKVADPRLIGVETLIPVAGPDDVEAALARSYRPLLRNRISTPRQTRSTDVNPILTRPDRSVRPRLNLVIPTLQPAKVFGGIATALRFFRELGDQLGSAVDMRIISVTDRVDMSCMMSLPDFRLLSDAGVNDRFDKVVLDVAEFQRGFIPVRPNDVFVATAWWTAANAFKMQEDQLAYHGCKQPVVYLIQDHEPNFYNWSPSYGRAQQTYRRPAETIAVINSEELTGYIRRRYPLTDCYVLPFELNRAIQAAIRPLPRERIIVVYGRPSVDRNCFQLLCAALSRWQGSHPPKAATWQIVSAGEAFDAKDFGHIRNLTVHGKLSLEDYGALLSRASVGVSLMASPHPSYPPLEMAYAGIQTVTNSFEGKDLGARAANIHSVADLDTDAIAAAIAEAVARAEPRIGTILPPTELRPLPCDTTRYDPAVLADRLRHAWVDAARVRRPIKALERLSA